MQNKFQEFRQKKPWAIPTLLSGIGLMSLAFAFNGPVVGPGALPIAPLLLGAGAVVAVIGIILIVRKSEP